MKGAATAPRVYLADVTPLEDPALFERALASVPEARREKVRAINNRQARLLSLAAGLLLGRGLRDAGIDPAAARILTGPYGKPYLAEGPFFSLSHSKERAMCVIAPCPAGCDTEAARPFDPRLPERFFTAEEQANIGAASCRETAFLRTWTLKESYIKMTGLGLRQPLNGFSVDIACLPPRLTAPDGERAFFAEYDPGDGYRMACCLEEDITPETFERIDFFRDTDF